MTSIPNNLCNLSGCNIYLNNNHICPPYPECISEDDLGYQNTSECFESQLGDINEDAFVNIVDIVTVVNIILNDGQYNYLGDVNQDGLINVVDIVSLVGLILDIWW